MMHLKNTQCLNGRHNKAVPEWGVSDKVKALTMVDNVAFTKVNYLWNADCVQLQNHGRLAQHSYPDIQISCLDNTKVPYIPMHMYVQVH